MKRTSNSRCFIVLFLFMAAASCNNTNKQHNDYSTPVEDALVEVEETVKEECPDCNGYGYFSISCSYCGGLGEIYHYTSGTRPKECHKCYGTGIVRCETCGGYGYTRCPDCNGKGSFQCTVCHGYGIIVIDPSRPHLSPKCNICDGTGYDKCLSCDGKGRIKCCNNGVVMCPICWGSGHSGQENYSNTSTEQCSNCDGTGCQRSQCDECDGSGKVVVKRIVKKRKSEL